MATITATSFTRYGSMNLNLPLNGTKTVHFNAEKGFSIDNENYVKPSNPVYGQLPDATVSIPVVLEDGTVTENTITTNDILTHVYSLFAYIKNQQGIS